MADRITAGLLLLVTLGFAYQAQHFHSSFFSDPVGARLVPWAIAALLLPLLLSLLWRPQQPELPASSLSSRHLVTELPSSISPDALSETAADTASETAAPISWRGLLLAISALLGYAWILEPLGFLLSTSLLFSALGLLLAAKLWQTALAGLCFASLLYALFVWGLALYLPTGTLWQRWW